MSTCELLHKKGWVANHDGNASIRIADDRFLVTPTATNKKDVTARSLLVVDQDGHTVKGEGTVFSEFNLHMALYAVRSDIKAVLHSHAPYATAFGITQNHLNTTIIPEVVVSLGDVIPLIPYFSPGRPEVTAHLQSTIRRVNAVLLTGNGMISVGRTMGEAFDRMELVEHLARVTSIIQASGLPRWELPESDKMALLDRRRRSGLDPSATFDRCEGSDVRSDPSQPRRPVDLHAVIREEITRILAAHHR